RRYVEPRTATMVARAIRSPRSRSDSMAARTSAISLMGVRGVVVLGGALALVRHERPRVVLEGLPTAGRAEVVRAAVVDGAEAGGGHLHRHPARGVDLLVPGGHGVGREARPQARRLQLDHLGKNGHGDLLVGHGAEVD